VRGDKVFLQNVYADDYMNTTAAGAFNKARAVEHAVTAADRRKANPQGADQTTPDYYIITCTPNTATVTHRNVTKALGDGKPTGPKETAEVMLVTWAAETERLRVTFRTTVTDGAYQFGNGAEVRDPPALPALPPPGGGGYGKARLNQDPPACRGSPWPASRAPRSSITTSRPTTR
jgi:hypothetical protein